jgi:hypothetical protein
MKDDKFLISIVVGIVVLIVVALAVVLLRAPGNEAYIPDDTPTGVVHNYFLALQKDDYEKAYSYLAEDVQRDVDLDKFIRDVDNFQADSQAALQIGEVSTGEARVQVDITITTYSPGGFFESNTYTQYHTALLKRAADGSGWRLTNFPYPYWGYDWGEPED